MPSAGAEALLTAQSSVPLPAPSALLPSFALGLELGTAGQTVTTPGQVPSHRAYVAPVLLSALVPGAGEIYLGHWKRGVPLVAVDVATWIFFGHFRSEGSDLRDQYEAFADAHWFYSGDTNGNGTIDFGETPGWQENLRQYYDGQSGPEYDFYDPSSPYNCTCPYIPKEEDAQHYYENIGKYLYYYPGWDDWAWNGDPATSDSQAHRLQYASMRQESNDNYDNATSMVVVAMLTRLGSVVQSALLVRNQQKQLQLRPVGLSGRGAGLRLAWRY
jgi:hypothetical protein